jgi:ribosomal protein S18 acetylase RimI-like enzyme
VTAAALSSRPEGPDDVGFLRALYRSTREAELALFGWDERQVDDFVRMQFEAQRTHHRANFPDADFRVLTLGGESIGRIAVDHGPRDVFLIDIALLPAHRGEGLGTHVLSAVLAEAAGAGKPVRLHVDRTNPALRLYERLGFRPIGHDDLSWHLEWRPSGDATARLPS